jgi:hypothetical protein
MYLLHGGSSCLEWTDFALATVATRPDEAGGPPPQLLRHTGQPREYRIEPLYNGLEGTDVVNDDTFFNPHKGTAAYLTESNAECKATNMITNSFLAGGDITIYACASATSGGGKTLIKDNRFARCTTTPITYFPEPAVLGAPAARN